MRISAEEIPNLPPFARNQGISADEELDILLFGTPNSWQKEMERQGFDPMIHTPAEVVEFMERLEATDDFEGTPVKDSKPAAKTSSKTTKSNQSKKPSSSGGRSTKHYCAVHGHNNSHSTEECNTIQQEAKRVKTNRSDYKGKSPNKTWQRKASEGQAKTKQELAAFIQKEVVKGIQKGKQCLAAYDKKRKADSDSESDDLAAFDLKDFNYEDMENLKIDDKTSDEVSI